MKMILPRKSVFIVLVLVLLFGLSYGGYRFYQSKPTSPQPATSSTEPTPAEETKPITQPTSDPDWNLYTNKKYGFSVEYPSRWEVKESIDGSEPCDEDPSIMRWWTSMGESGVGYLRIDVWCAVGSDVLSWVSLNPFLMALSSIAGVPSEINAEVAGLPSIVVYSPSDGQAPRTIAFALAKDGFVFRISHGRWGDSVGEPLLWDIYEHFLRTFEFEGTKDIPDELPKFPMGT